MSRPPAEFTVLKRLKEENEILRDAIARLKSGDGGGTSGGMDPWQTTVETRLGQVHTGLEGVKSGVSTANVTLATLTERVSHLPTKGWGVTAIIAIFTVVGAIVTLAPILQAFFHTAPKP